VQVGQDHQPKVRLELTVAILFLQASPQLAEELVVVTQMVMLVDLVVVVVSQAT
jgi:hypothetical protein